VIVVDRALERRAAEGRPIELGIVGAGFMGRAVTRQIASSVPGIRVAAIANRHLDRAERSAREAGLETEAVDDAAGVSRALAAGRTAITEDYAALCEAPELDAVFEVTGTIDFGARVVLAAIENGKHVVLMNAELDGTLGPILKDRADRAGVVFTNVDGDQPGTTLNLCREVSTYGLRPVLCGNIKGLEDPYRTPETQAGFAARWGQERYMVTSFADGSKISFEQAITANATGMHVLERGMLGPEVPAGTPIEECAGLFPAERLLEGEGVVDYVIGASPPAGVFVLAYSEDSWQRHYLDLFKLGEGPIYCFYTAHHLCQFEAPITVARAVDFGDAAVAPLGPPCVEVVAAAKTDLTAGSELEGYGGFHLYGQCENAEPAAAERLLPIGLAEGCRLVRDVARDAFLTYDDVELPAGRLADELRRDQNEVFGLAAPEPAAR
jgi:predicted homoserine dehydrogenase-like protein